jgi:3-deoxy-D-manno-octulosonic-acid transferase
MEPARALYTLAGCAALPWLPLRLWWRGRREPGYRRHVGERFGRYRTTVPSPLFWIHAVSVGETRAAVPLSQKLRAFRPDATILLTHMTATGRDAGKAIAGTDTIQAWLPYDLPFAVRRFYDHFRPAAGFLVETELWPNLIAGAAGAGVPLFLVNARLSERSAAGYAKWPALSRPMLGRLAGIAAQSPADAARLQALGGNAPIVTGNIKFDVSPSQELLALAKTLRRDFGESRPVWVAASTRDGEEALILDALTRQPLEGNALLVLVPRHPQRFDAVAELLRSRGIDFARRSANATVPANVGVVLGDTMGEMFAYYAAADLAFVGGSLLPLGGQNLLEALAVGTPVLIGPHTFNFADATDGALAAGAALRVADADALVAAVRSLLTNPARRKAMREAAHGFHGAHQGAVDRLWDWLGPQLEVRGVLA